MRNEQMELGFSDGRRLPPTRRQHRLERAAWWFTQMRQAVDRAFDWQATPTPRPEQTWLPDARQRVRAHAGHA